MTTPTTLGTDHGGAQDSGHGSSLRDCEGLMVFLRELYGGSIKINRACDVIHELFQKKQNGQFHG